MPDKLLLEINDKYGEWLEHAGDKAPATLCYILAKMIIKEREQNLYLTRRLEHERINTR